MQRKRIWQYRCDFCGKRSLSAGHMKVHECHCTMNPNRSCRMCDAGECDAQPLDELKAMIPDPIFVNDDSPFPQAVNGTDITKAIERVLSAANGCPACTLAAIRQRGITGYEYGWDYTAACKLFWDDR